LKRIKGCEIIKAVTAFVLAIGLFSTAFINAAVPVFALPLSAADVSKDYKKPNLTVYISPIKAAKKSADTISPEEAAELGARYIWDVFGVSIDGKTVEMFYSKQPSHTKAYWMGTVAESKEDMDRTDVINKFHPQFTFTISAVSGERIDIDAWENGDADDSAERASAKAIFTAQMKLSRDESVKLDEKRKQSDLQPQKVIEECTQAAKNYAAKHFTGTEVVSVVFDKTSAAAYGVDKNGKLIIVPSEFLYFKVTDSAGREAEISIGVKSKELRHIITSHNDIVQGYDASVGGVG
jgi:hypothetical protein